MLDIKKLLAKVLKRIEFPVTAKNWAGQSVSANTWKAMTTFSIPANTRALILAQTGNGVTGAVNNACNFELTRGTAKTAMLASTNNNSTLGNSTAGWAYVETNTACTLSIRQYGYQAFTDCNGRAVAINLGGGAIT